MKFQSEKKELWRYASKNLSAPVRGTNRQQLLPHRLLHQRLPQSPRSCSMMIQSTQHPSFLGYCKDFGESSTTLTPAVNILRQANVSTPPPPYTSVLELDCSSNGRISDICLMFRQDQMYPTNGEMETTVSATDSDIGYNQKQALNKNGSSFENTGDTMPVEGYEKLSEISTFSSHQLSADILKRPRQGSPQQQNTLEPSVVVSATTTTSPTTSFAAAAAKILRNCCGGTFGSSNSITTTQSNTNISNAYSNLNCEHSKSGIDHLAKNGNNYLPEHYFSILMKQLKASQVSLLLKAVKSRHDQVIPITSSNPTASSSSLQRCCGSRYQTNCILISRTEIFGEEPYVIACRLFLWRDLKHASQLKRLPVCPNENDPVYICCNPLHWCRILETGLNQQNAINVAPFGSTYPDRIWQRNCDRRGLVTESQTTDGEGRRFSPNWCEVAYWELAQRVGDRFPAYTPTINIYSDRPYTSTGDEIDVLSLKELIAKRETPSPDDVRYTRQKIGLGITLSQESDGVWLYNRSMVPIFVYSPTLTESWYRVCRVEPGDCLIAFDKDRVQTPMHPGQLSGLQTGPIDKYSMRISFGKGWGSSYKRPDVTLCPCWLEVLFKPQR